MIFQRAGRIAPVLHRYTKLIVSAREIISHVGIVRLLSYQLLIEGTRLAQIFESTRRVCCVLELRADLHITVGQTASIIRVARIGCDHCFTNSERLLIAVKRSGHVANACAVYLATPIAPPPAAGSRFLFRW